MKEKILQYLSQYENVGMGPTEIGLALGKSYTSASSSVTPALKKLVAEGKVVRLVIPPGKVVYQFKKQP